LRVWDHDGSARGEPIAAHQGFVVSVAVNAKGDVVSTGTDQAVRGWQADTSGAGYRPHLLHRVERAQRKAQLAHLLKLDLNMGWDHALDFSPRAAALAAAGFDGSVMLWTGLDSGNPKTLHAAGLHNVRTLAWAPKGDLLAAGGFDGKVEMWGADGSPRGLITEHPAPILSVAFSPSGSRLATASIDSVRLWKVDGQPIAELPAGAAPPMTTLTLTETGPLFASAAPTGDLRRWRIDGSPAVEVGTAAPGVLALALSASGDLFAAGDVGQAWLFRSNGGTAPKTSLGSYVDEAAYSPRGDLIAIAGNPGMVELLKSDGSAHAPPFRACQETIFGFAFSPVEDTLAVLCEFGVVKLLTLDLQPRGTLLEQDAGAARGLAIAPSGEWLASGGLDSVMGFWALPARQRVDGPYIGLNVDQVGLQGTGSWALANGNSVFFFNADRRLVATAVVAPDGVAAFTPDGSFAASRGAERLVRAFRADGSPLTAAETAERLAPAKVLAALRPS
jgi:WD40 repeat protein